MSVIGSNILAGASGQGGGYNLTRSLRFRKSASAYLNRTPASAGNRQKWTYSAWIKRGSISSADDQALLTAQANGNTGTPWGMIQISSSDRFIVYEESALAQAIAYQSITNAQFRDPSAWYHFFASVDTTQATSSERVKIWVNGVLQTLTGSYPSQNHNTQINSAVEHTIGRYVYQGNSRFFDGYIAEQHFIDGQALTPSSFGETSSTTGVWQPKKYAGTYGTNGFYLPFTDNSALTSGSNAGLGKDFSGNGNYWNTNNISITSGVTYDSMVDVPTIPAVSTDVSAPSNYSTLNPLNAQASSGTYSNGNLKFVGGSDGHGAISTILLNSSISGKWYWEATFQATGQYGIFGIRTTSGNLNYFWTSSGFIYNNAGYTGISTSTYGVGDVLAITVDFPNNVVKLYKNNSYVRDLCSASYFNGSDFGCFMGGGNTGATWDANFGQRPFAYTPPTGFVALNTYNLPTPTIGATASTQANDYFNILTWTGNSSNPRTISGLGFQPDMTWYKSRSVAGAPAIYDVVRGYGAGKMLSTNQASVEGQDSPYTDTDYGYLTQNSDGITLNSGNVSGVWVNDNTKTYVGWNWKANGTGVTNTAGSITSTVSANTTSGFSVVTYTGTGSAATVGHGLGVKPAMIIFKNRGSAYNWRVWHQSLSSQTQSYLSLNLTNAVGTDATIWNNTAPTSTVFSVGADASVNESSKSTVAYCFSAVAGYSAFGSYVGNGSSDSPFIYLGFKPRFIMFKKSSASQNWLIYDSARDTYNQLGNILYPNLSSAEYVDSNKIDFLSNGVKIRSSQDDLNGSGGTYIYAAFAEHPFKYSLGR